MTNLHDINFGINEYCGPVVLSALTGLSTDRCAAAISAVTGQKSAVKGTDRRVLVEVLKRLRFDVVETNIIGMTLYGVLFKLPKEDGFYIIHLPKHVVAVEVQKDNIYLCDNHSKHPIDIRHSARLLQKVEKVLKVIPKEPPQFIKSEILVGQSFAHGKTSIIITRHHIYKNHNDNVIEELGKFNYNGKGELAEIARQLQRAVSES